MDDYRRVADEIAGRIVSGRLRPGDRLPTQRAFARQRGIANSTAARVYAELSRRGLTLGEVGRGTFVRASTPRPGPALAEPSDGKIDLELNHPVVPGQAGLLAEGISPLLRPDVLDEAMRPVGTSGTAPARALFADLLSRPGWRPDPARILFAANGRQAVSAAVSALVRPGARLGVEELTYPAVRAIAARLGVTVVAIPLDEEGMIPEAVEEAARVAPLSAVYLQPTLHNPLSLSMTERRRIELAGLLSRLGVNAIEDGVWTFLRDTVPPLASFAPERTIFVDSLSKRVAPGLGVGFMAVPEPLVPEVAAALRAGGGMPMRFALEAATRWLTDGVVRAVAEAKRRDVGRRHRIAAERLDGFAVRDDPCSYYCWWDLSEGWRADTFVAAAARHGIGVTPAAAFAVDPRRAPNAVRIGLASPPEEALSRALATLAGIARTAPEELVSEW
ncbi:PLP-dependent aminotransferase family protein [Marinactinospora endophytica]